MFANTHKKTHITVQSLLVLMLIVLIIIGTFNATLSSFSRVGLLALLISLGVANILLLSHYAISKKMHKQHLAIMLISLIFILINLLGLFSNFNSRSLITLTQFVTLIGFFIFSSLIKWNDFRVKIVRNVAITYIMINFLLWAGTGFSMPFKSFYPNPNLIGIFTFLILFFVLMDKNKKKLNTIFLIASTAIIYASGSRAALLALVITLFTYFIWPFISKNKVRFISYITLVITGILSFIFIYPKLIYWSNYYVVSEFVRQYTGKNLYSGREIIWANLQDKINEKPLLGYGTGVLPQDVLESGLSAHNFYLQIALQNGYLGLFVFLILLISIWLVFRKNRENHIVRLSASFFIAILVYLSFEVSLTQNQIASGIIMWFIFSVGVSYSINNHKSDETT